MARTRRRGLSPRPQGHGLLLRSRSVHGFGLVEELALVGIASDERVCALRVLHPNRIVTVLQCRWMLELPIDHPMPHIGDRITPMRLRPIPPHNPA